MLAILAFTSEQVVCIGAIKKKNEPMSVVSYAAVPYVGFRRGKIITSLGLRPAIAEAISQAEEIAGKRADSVVVGVPTLYTNTVPMLSADGGDDWLAPEDPENKSYQPIHYLKYSVEGEDGPVPMMAAIMMEHAFEAEVETALRNIKLRSREFKFISELGRKAIFRTEIFKTFADSCGNIKRFFPGQIRHKNNSHFLILLFIKIFM